MDITTSLMMLIPKLLYFTFYYSNGKIKQIPSLMEFLGFGLFYPAVIVGPVIDYSTYKEFIYNENL